MRKIGALLNIGLGLSVSAAALAVASNLGATGHAGAADGATIFAAVIATSLLHIPATVLMSTVHMAADGLEARLEGIVHADRPVANEDVQRAGRRAAIGGVKVAVNRYDRSARADAFDHDLEEARRFRKAVLRWCKKQLKATGRSDRPSTGGWNQAGLGYPGVLSYDGPEAVIRAIEDAAWTEFVPAMAREGVAIPKHFDKYFTGAENCGYGWRRAGHLLFMRELKRNHDAFVGFVVDDVLSRRNGPLQPDTTEPPRPPRPPAIRKRREGSPSAKPVLNLKRPRPRPKQPQPGS